jgi:hypothetical protein
MVTADPGSFLRARIFRITLDEWTPWPQFLNGEPFRRAPGFLVRTGT